MKLGNNKLLKKVLTVLVVPTALVSGLAIWACVKTPGEGSHTWRSTHRSDGVHKRAYSSGTRANWQCIWQFIRWGEICESYEEPSGFYTGHKRKITN